ncbi:hypothetical protein AO203_09655 [Lactobacillus gallinarum]|nr:hypothetical protein AO203_09655 [Lactobacillus gallinarum]
MTEDFLKNAIQNEAILKFNSKWNQSPEDEKVRMTYQKLKNTPEFDEFANAMIECYRKEITSNVLHSMEGLQNLVRDAGEE